MKILHVTDASAAGVLAAVTGLARAQSESPDIETVRVSYTPRPESPSHAQISAAMGPRVDVRRLSQRPASAVPGLIRGLVRELRRSDFDIIHLHSSRAGFLGRLLASGLRPSAQVVYSPHGFSFDRSDFSSAASVVFLAMERLAMCGARGLVLVSEGEAQVARARLPKARTAVLPNVVDTAAFAPASPVARSGAGDSVTEVLRIVHIGRIMAQKQPETFARIAARAEEVHPGRFEFVWIGDGRRELLQGPSVPVEVTGWVSREELHTQLSAASAMLFTSSGEGMPISLLEASSMGVPTVGFDVVGVRDLISDGANGYLVSTVDEAVAALGRLLHPPTRKSLAAVAREKVIAHHSRADLAKRSLRTYRDLGRSGARNRPEHPAVPAPTDTTVTTTGRRSS